MDGSQCLVCRIHRRVASWAGPVGCAPKKSDGSKGAKIQGPLLVLIKQHPQLPQQESHPMLLEQYISSDIVSILIQG